MHCPRASLKNNLCTPRGKLEEITVLRCWCTSCDTPLLSCQGSEFPLIYRPVRSLLRAYLPRADQTFLAARFHGSLFPNFGGSCSLARYQTVSKVEFSVFSLGIGALVERENFSAHGSAPGETSALSTGRGWTAPHALTSGRGPGEGSFSRLVIPQEYQLPDLSNCCCLPGRAGESPK